MSRQLRIEVVIGRRTLFVAQSPEQMVAAVENKAAFWETIFPVGLRNKHGDTILRPNYAAVAALASEHPFELGKLDLFGRPDLAVFPVAESAEGRALPHYAPTDFAFAILAFLWAEAGWLTGREAADSSDKVAKGIGEMLVTAVRLGSTFR